MNFIYKSTHQLERNENENLMASTEVETNPFMVKILEKNEFIQKGKT
ncbi:hypothetical protein NU09_0035 [Flavobacterium beibuense]|uniref:Uncharacterized protein n=1 Tax=Flavobacterium beibuense TaxID=657326 RepID=A0A444WHW2_9FLAO|nr:hypothetical protein NU09_0035 [Flavobacterium beibuense]